MSKKLCIYASDLAIITGNNKYQKRSDILLKIWTRNYPDDYQNILKLSKDNNLDIILDESDIECIDRISKNGNIDVSLELDKCLRSRNISDLSNNRDVLLDKCKDKITTSEFTELKKSLLDLSNTNFGTKNENDGISLYTKNTGVEVVRVDKFYKKFIYSKNDIDWYLGGKIDGIRKDKILVEIKNRAYKLFNKVRDYEMVQVLAYMNILDISQAHLMEVLKEKTKSDYNILEIEYDDLIWINTIKPKIYRFIDFFDRFINNDKIKLMLITNNVSKLDKIIDNYMDC